MPKSTVDEIRRRFDADVDRFSNLETGQSATMDAPLVLDLIARSAVAVNPSAKRLLDVGCGAGNYTLKLMQGLKLQRVTLIDLSQPMLDRASERIHAADPHVEIRTMQTDVRQADLAQSEFDIITAAAVLHHLRTDLEWQAVFAKFHAALSPNGSLWVSDIVDHEIPGVRKIAWQRFGEYLEDFKGPEYRQKVFDYIEQEDTPRSLAFQINTLRKVGFSKIEVLHANACFAAYVAIK
ncbi:MAG TPA: class I SAM-dependent methyltransferase [Tepidisphaeraceae bacterium]|nr:class I SAM-dependent methyltransferase [Tepidisphaeraceae bacterium]